MQQPQAAANPTALQCDAPRQRARRNLRLPAVLEIVGCSRSTWYELVQRGVAPAPLRLHPTRISVWDAEGVEQFIERSVTGQR